MSSLQDFEASLKDAVGGKRLSASKMAKTTEIAMSLMAEDTKLVSIVYRTHKNIHPACKVSSLYAFDALARAARSYANKHKQGADQPSTKGNCASFLRKMEGVLDGVFKDMLTVDNEEAKEKTKKVLDIWVKANTFPPAVLSRLSRIVEGSTEKDPVSSVDGVVPSDTTKAVPTPPATTTPPQQSPPPATPADVQSTLMALLSQAQSAVGGNPFQTNTNTPGPQVDSAVQALLVQQLAQAQAQAPTGAGLPSSSALPPVIQSSNVPYATGVPPPPTTDPRGNSHIPVDPRVGARNAPPPDPRAHAPTGQDGVSYSAGPAGTSYNSDPMMGPHGAGLPASGGYPTGPGAYSGGQTRNYSGVGGNTDHNGGPGRGGSYNASGPPYRGQGEFRGSRGRGRGRWDDRGDGGGRWGNERSNRSRSQSPPLRGRQGTHDGARSPPSRDYAKPHLGPEMDEFGREIRPGSAEISDKPSTPSDASPSKEVASSTQTEPVNEEPSAHQSTTTGLGSFDFTTFDFTQPASWEALGNAWKETNGYIPTQEVLMQFVMTQFAMTQGGVQQSIPSAVSDQATTTDAYTDYSVGSNSSGWQRQGQGQGSYQNRGRGRGFYRGGERGRGGYGRGGFRGEQDQWRGDAYSGSDSQYAQGSMDEFEVRRT